MIKKALKIFRIITVSAAVLAVTGCLFPTKESNVQYVYDMYGLNYKQGSKFYLNHDLWYKDPMDISAINYHEGDILPVGTEIDIIKSFAGYVTFKVVDTGKEYKIVNDTNMTLLSDEIQFHRLIGTKNPLEDLKISEKDLAAIKKGKLLLGMTRQEVLLAYGKPPRSFNPPYSRTTWVYLLNDQYKARHVVFKNDKVIYVFDC